MCMENIATRLCVYSVFITPLTYSTRSVVRHLELEGVGGGNKTLVDNYGILEVQNAFPYH